MLFIVYLIIMQFPKMKMMNLILRDMLQLLLTKPKIDCTQEQIIKEFRSILPVINQVWVQFENEKKGALKRFLIFILDK